MFPVEIFNIQERFK